MGTNVDDLRAPSNFTPHTPEEQQRGEAWLLELGWVKHKDGTWTAPKALRKARKDRLGRPGNRYNKIDYGHAFNTQRHEDRTAPLPGRFSGDELVQAVEHRMAQGEVHEVRDKRGRVRPDGRRA